MCRYYYVHYISRIYSPCIKATLYLLTNISPFPLHPNPLATILFSALNILTFLDSTYKWDDAITTILHPKYLMVLFLWKLWCWSVLKENNYQFNFSNEFMFIWKTKSHYKFGIWYFVFVQKVLRLQNEMVVVGRLCFPFYH